MPTKIANPNCGIKITQVGKNEFKKNCFVSFFSFLSHRLSRFLCLTAIYFFFIVVHRNIHAHFFFSQFTSRIVAWEKKNACAHKICTPLANKQKKSYAGEPQKFMKQSKFRRLNAWLFSQHAGWNLDYSICSLSEIFSKLNTTIEKQNKKIALLMHLRILIDLS